MKNIIYAFAFIIFTFCTISFAQDKDAANLKYKLLATTRTSTMQKEVDETAAQGYRILVGSPTSGSEMALFLSRDGTNGAEGEYDKCECVNNVFHLFL